MNDQYQKRQIYKRRRPSYIRRTNSKQHCDSENDYSRIKRRAKKYARPQRRYRALRRFGAAIKPRVEPLKNRNRDRGDEIPAQVVADRNSEMRPWRVVPEDLAQKPPIAQ